MEGQNDGGLVVGRVELSVPAETVQHEERRALAQLYQGRGDVIAELSVRLGKAEEARDILGLEIRNLRNDLTARDAEIDFWKAEAARLTAQTLPNVEALKGAQALVLYFGNDADREEFRDLILSLHPNMRALKVQS